MRIHLFTPRGLALCLLVSRIVLSASAAPLQLVSAPEPLPAPPASGSGDSWAPRLSSDGRYVLFASTANNLLLPSNNVPLPACFPANLNVFLRDRSNAATALVSVNLTGLAGGNGDSLPVNVSTNGRYVLFESSASDLVPGDTNNASDVFVRDLVAGTTLLVSVSTNGAVGNGASYNSAMTPDGRFVAFVSAANNLVPGDTNRIPDVFVRDLQAGVTLLASVGAISTNLSFPSGGSDGPDLTPDGHYVAFSSTATNLVPGAPPGGDIYVRDLVGGNTIWASTGARARVQSALGSANALCFNHTISADGQFIAYEASAGASAGLVLRYGLGTGSTDLAHTNAAVTGGAYPDACSLAMTPDGRFIAFVANTNSASGTPITTCVLVWDAQGGTLQLASGDLTGQVPAGSACHYPTLDSTGRWLVFLSDAVGLVTNSLVGDYHLYVRDLLSGSITLADADTNGVGWPVSVATVPSLSADGRWVAFDSAASGLVANDRNQDSDGFACDLATGAIELVSARHPSLPCLTPNGLSTLALRSVSGDARLIAFASDADNIAANDTNRCRDIFVRDTATGANVLVSVDTNGFSADGPSTDPAISPDGRFVAFTSSADNLTAGDTNQVQDVFLRDLQAGTTRLVSVNLNGTGPGNGPSYSPLVSSGGRYVLFRSQASNLATGAFASVSENLFLRDLLAGTTYALSTTGASSVPAAMTPDGRFSVFAAASANSSSYQYLYVWDAQAAARIYTNTLGGSSYLVSAAIRPDGRQVVFSYPNNLYLADPVAGTNRLVESGSSPSGHLGLRLSGDGQFLVCSKVSVVNGTPQVYLYDSQTGTNLLVSRSYDLSTPANGPSDSPDISADGRFVTYRSAATNLVPGDVNGVPDIFLYDRSSGATMLLSASQAGGSPADNRSLRPVFSADSQTLVFQSWASDLVAQDFNRWSDLFAYQLYASGPVPFFYASMLPAAPGQTPWLTWPMASGSTYRVQFKSSLSDPDWHDLSGTVTAIGNQGFFKDPASAPGQRFYRIVAF